MNRALSQDLHALGDGEMMVCISLVSVVLAWRWGVLHLELENWLNAR